MVKVTYAFHYLLEVEYYYRRHQQVFTAENILDFPEKYWYF